MGADPDGLTHSPFDSPREAETRFGSAAGVMASAPESLGEILELHGTLHVRFFRSTRYLPD